MSKARDFYANIAMPFKHSSECARLINKLRSLTRAWFLVIVEEVSGGRRTHKVTISELFLTVIIHTRGSI